jgi:dihydroorotate dehydrogenase
LPKENIAVGFEKGTLDHTSRSERVDLIHPFSRWRKASGIELPMSWFYRTFVRPMLFTVDSEEIHNHTLEALGKLSRSRLGLDFLGSFYGMPQLPTSLWNLNFPNPVGLAAGMDKQAQAVPAWAAFGFGFSELGGVTWHSQPGNPAPRMFRVVPDGALINRMGFNNPGAEAMAQRLTAWKASGLWPAIRLESTWENPKSRPWKGHHWIMRTASEPCVPTLTSSW